MLLQIQEPSSRENTDIKNTDVAIGIDLGTTHSLAGVSRNGKVEIFTDSNGNFLIPSAVSYKSGTSSVGHKALKNKKNLPILSIKRLMGKGYKDVKAFAGDRFSLDSSKTEGMAHVLVDSHSISPVEISAEILKELKHIAETNLGQPVSKAVITVPAYFDDAARSATRDAARLAGLEVLRILNEPTAAAVAYGLENRATGIYVIYDFGGGTFDVSVLSIKDGVFRVLATGGDTALGGDDIDQFIFDWVKKQLHLNELTLAQSSILRSNVRRAKEALSTSSVSHIQFEDQSISLTIDIFNGLIKDLIRRTLDMLYDVLLESNVSIENVDACLLVGGSTRIPLVQEKLTLFFSQEPLSAIDPEQAVVRGASLQAENLTRGSDTLLLDVVPLSLGLETLGEIVEKVIPRNSPIPISKAQDFTTYEDGQTGMVIHVLQGERELVKDCRSLAKFELTGIPPLKAGQARIRVMFTVDADGLLTVSAEEMSTGIRQQVEVKPSYGLDPNRISQLLWEALENGKEDIHHRLWTEAVVEAKQLLKAVDAALDDSSNLLIPNEEKTILTAKNQLIEAIDRTPPDRDLLLQAIKDLELSSQSFAERRMEHILKKSLIGKSTQELRKN